MKHYERARRSCPSRRSMPRATLSTIRGTVFVTATFVWATFCSPCAFWNNCGFNRVRVLECCKLFGFRAGHIKLRKLRKTGYFFRTCALHCHIVRTYHLKTYTHPENHNPILLSGWLKRWNSGFSANPLNLAVALDIAGAGVFRTGCWMASGFVQKAL